MHRKDRNSLPEKAIGYSLAVHFAGLLLWAAPVSGSKRDDMLLMSVQIGGDGEWGAPLPAEPVPETMRPANAVPMPEPKEEIQPADVAPAPESKEEEIKPADVIPTPASPEEIIVPDVAPIPVTVPEEIPAPPIPQPLEEIRIPFRIPEIAPAPESKKRDAETIPTTPGDKAKTKKDRIKQKIRNQIVDTVLEALRVADKKKTKERKLKKVLEIVEKAEYKKKKDRAFDRMLSRAPDDLRKAPAAEERRGGGGGGKSDGSGGTGGGGDLIASAINEMIRPHWIIPSGVKNAENVAVDIQVQLGKGGKIKSAKVLDEKRYATDPVFRAAADSARRAILEMGSLKISGAGGDLLKDHEDFTFHFDPGKMLRGNGD
jgi:hypothetical protein